MANSSSFKVTPCSTFVEGIELDFSGLYLYHTPLGPSHNQVGVQRREWFGYTSANNWTVREGLGSDAKVVARAQGLHIKAAYPAGKWYNSFSLVFEDERFKGSTLQVMGVVVEEGEWAIVGGTGQFAMATGVIRKKFHKQESDGNIMELTIRGFCPLFDGSRVQNL